MKCLLKLFNTEDTAADGSVISRNVVEEYLNSNDYKYIINNKLSVGGLTHKDRGSEQLEQYSSIGEDDVPLITDNITHYITKIFFKDATDNNCYAEIEIFNPDDFSGKRKDNIKNLEGMLKSGMMLPVSIVIQAQWSSQERCEKIIRIKGVDITLNPSFPNAGIIKVYSEHNEPNVRTISTRKYSKEKFEKIKVFSATIAPEIPMEPTDNNLTDREYKLKYGIKNKQYNPSREGTPKKEVQEVGKIKEFSYSVPAIEARMRMIYIEPKSLLRRLLRNYTIYYNNYKDRLTEKQIKYLKLILVQDINYLVRLQLADIVKGANLSTKFGLSSFGNRELMKAAYVLGVRYRRAILCEKRMGFIPKNIYNQWLDGLEDFYNQITKMIFDLSINLEDFDMIQDKSFSGYTEIGVGLDEQNDYKSINNTNGGKIGGIQFLTIIDPAFGIDSKLQNYFCKESKA